MNKPIYSIVIPVFSEEKNLIASFTKINDIIRALNEPYEIIFIDDGSTDNTWNILLGLAKKHPFLKLIKLSRNFGKEFALSAGLKMARGNAVITIDADLQHPPELIPKMIELWKNSVEIVEAVKVYRGGEPIINRLGASFFYNFLDKLSDYKLNNATDFKLMDRKVINAWLKMPERNLFFRGMSAWLGYTRIQIPFEVQKRIGGKSHWSIFQLARLAITGITAFSSLPLHFITLLGIIFFIFSIIVGIQTLYMKMAGLAVTGFVTVILLLLIVGSVLMTALGIIGLYIARIYDEVKNRPRYIITQIVNDDILDT